MADKVTPALTPDDWERDVVAQVVRERHGVRIVDWNNPGVVLDNPHGTAAALLHGQPFGFTWKDVDRLRIAVGEVAQLAGATKTPLSMALADLADRIAALLPPRER